MLKPKTRGRWVNPLNTSRERREVRAGFPRRGHIVVAMLAMLIAVGVVPLATMS